MSIVLQEKIRPQEVQGAHQGEQALGSKPVDSIAPWLAPASFPALTSLHERLELGKLAEINPSSPSCFWAWRFITAIEHLTKAIDVGF